MNLNILLVTILAAVLLAGGAGAAGYTKGKTDAERVAKIAMDEHLIADREEETKAKDKALADRDALVAAQNAVSAAYEKEKHDAEQNSKRVVADIRAGNLVLRNRWAACQTSLGVSTAPPAPSEPDAGTGDREESAGRIVQAADQCDAQVKGLQELLILERQLNVQQPQPEVGARVGMLPD